MSKEAMKLALEALETAWTYDEDNADGYYLEAITALREALANEALDKMAENARELGLDYEPAQQEPVACQYAQDVAMPEYRCVGRCQYDTSPPAQQEPVAHAVIAGALFDFMGWLTSRKERIVLSSADNASPVVEAIIEFAKMRGLSLNDAKVQDWNTSPPAQRPWQGLTDEEIEQGCKESWVTEQAWQSAVWWAEARLKEKNT